MPHHHLHFTNYSWGVWSAHAVVSTEYTPVIHDSTATRYTFSSSHIPEKRPYHHDHSWWKTMCHPVGCPCAIHWYNSQTSWQLHRGLLNLCPTAVRGSSLASQRQPHKAEGYYSGQLQSSRLSCSLPTDFLHSKHYLPWPMSEVTFLTWNTRKSWTAVTLEGTMNQKAWQPHIQGMVTIIKRIALLLMLTSHTNSQCLSQGWWFQKLRINSDLMPSS